MLVWYDVNLHKSINTKSLIDLKIARAYVDDANLVSPPFLSSKNISFLDRITYAY